MTAYLVLRPNNAARPIPLLGLDPSEAADSLLVGQLEWLLINVPLSLDPLERLICVLESSVIN